MCPRRLSLESVTTALAICLRTGLLVPSTIASSSGSVHLSIPKCKTIAFGCRSLGSLSLGGLWLVSLIKAVARKMLIDAYKVTLYLL